MLRRQNALRVIAATISLTLTASSLLADDSIKTAAVHRGNLAIVVGATGSLEPQRVVDVNAEVAGRIAEFGADPRGATDPAYKGKTIDFGTPVEAGTLLVKIDDATYAIAVERARAAVARAQADLEQANAKLELAKVEADAANAQRDTAEAHRKVAEAAVGVARAALTQTKIDLSEAQLQLSRTKIVSPIKGVIIDRRVDVGQNVVSSVGSSLFLIAADLKDLQVWASINEADIAKIKKGELAVFTCDAFPGKEFQARVQEIRLNATMTKNVVTYTVTLSVEPTDVPLLPYLTAQVQIECSHRDNVLLVPTAALRWRPPERLIWPQPDRNYDPKAKNVWVREGKLFRAIEVHTGASGAAGTQITGVGMDIITLVFNDVRRERRSAGLAEPRQLRRYLLRASGEKTSEMSASAAGAEVYRVSKFFSTPKSVIICHKMYQRKWSFVIGHSGPQPPPANH